MLAARVIHQFPEFVVLVLVDDAACRHTPLGGIIPD